MAKQTIYVFAPDLSHPLGGMRMLYRHVDILNANGLQAYIVHNSPKFEIGWFEYSTPVIFASGYPSRIERAIPTPGCGLVPE